MKNFEQPILEFISFGDDQLILMTSCGQFNCTNPLGYGDLCAGPTGHSSCQNFSCDHSDCPYWP